MTINATLAYIVFRAATSPAAVAASARLSVIGSFDTTVSTSTARPTALCLKLGV